MMFIIKVYSFFSVAKLACPASDRAREQKAGRARFKVELDPTEAVFLEGIWETKAICGYYWQIIIA
jgi:hypothetical protein